MTLAPPTRLVKTEDLIDPPPPPPIFFLLLALCNCILNFLKVKLYKMTKPILLHLYSNRRISLNFRQLERRRFSLFRYSRRVCLHVKVQKSTFPLFVDKKYMYKEPNNKADKIKWKTVGKLIRCILSTTGWCFYFKKILVVCFLTCRAGINSICNNLFYNIFSPFPLLFSYFTSSCTI